MKRLLIVVFFALFFLGVAFTFAPHSQKENESKIAQTVGGCANANGE